MGICSIELEFQKIIRALDGGVSPQKAKYTP
jgi:hypothetical protein